MVIDSMGVLAILTSWLTFLLLHPNPIGLGLFSLALLCGLLRGRLDIPRLQWILLTVVGLLMALGLYRLQANGRFTGLIFHTVYPVALTLGLSCLPALLRRHSRYEYWAAMVLSALFFMVCGLTIEPVTGHFAALSAAWSSFFCLSSCRVLSGRRPRREAYLTLVPAVFLLGGIAVTYAFSERQANWLLRLLSASGDSSLAFPAQSRLNTMMNSETNPAVVLRCFSKRPNRYLPARVYTRYQELMWKEDGPSQNQQGESLGDGRYRYPTGVAPQGDEPVVEEYEVNRSPIVLMAPRDGQELVCNQPLLALLSGHLWEMRGGGSETVRYQVKRFPDESLAPPEQASYLEHCRELPEGLNPIIAQQAQAVMGPATDPLARRAIVLQNWLQDNFTYGFGHDWASSQDPVGEFLTSKPPAHCEVFATAMTLMLRTQGIAARYINGFVVVEPSLGGDYYVVRVRDAHAWVEVWDGSQWLVLDPTPPAAIQPGQSWTSWFESIREALAYHFRFLQSLNWKQALAWLWKQKKWLGLILLAWVAWKFGKLRRAPRPHARKYVPGEDHPLVQELQAQLRRHGVERQPWETLLSWGRRLQDWQHGQGVAQWLQEFSAFRYGRQGSDESALSARLRDLIRSLRSLPK